MVSGELYLKQGSHPYISCEEDKASLFFFLFGEEIFDALTQKQKAATGLFKLNIIASAYQYSWQ